MTCNTECTNEDCLCLPEDFDDVVVIEGSVWGFILVMVLTMLIFGCVGWYIGKLHLRSQLFEACMTGQPIEIDGYKPDFACWRLD